MIDIPKTFDELRAAVKADVASKPEDATSAMIVLTGPKLLECALLDLRRIADAAERKGVQ